MMFKNDGTGDAPLTRGGFVVRTDEMWKGVIDDPMEPETPEWIDLDAVIAALRSAVMDVSFWDAAGVRMDYVSTDEMARAWSFMGKLKDLP